MEKHWDPEEREHYRKERFYWKVTAFLTFLAVIGAIGTVVLTTCSLEEASRATRETHRQADEAVKQTAIADQTLRYTQRAFIYIKEFNTSFVPFPVTEIPNSWGFQPHWINEGNTVPIDLTLETHCGLAPNEDSMPDMNAKSPFFLTVTRSVGPKQEVFGPFCILWPPNIEAVQSGKTSSFRFSRAKYKDVFVTQHVTERCEIISSIKGNPRVFTEILLGTATPCKKHNCFDEQCEKATAN